MTKIAKTVATLLAGGLALSILTGSASAAFTRNGLTPNGLTPNGLTPNGLNLNGEVGSQVKLDTSVQSIELSDGTVVELR